MADDKDTAEETLKKLEKFAKKVDSRDDVTSKNIKDLRDFAAKFEKGKTLAQRNGTKAERNQTKNVEQLLKSTHKQSLKDAAFDAKMFLRTDARLKGLHQILHRQTIAKFSGTGAFPIQQQQVSFYKHI